MSPSKAGSKAYNYTVAPHLAEEFDIPMEKFAAAHPEADRFIVGGFVFAKSPLNDIPFSASASAASAAEKLSSNSNSGFLPLMLVMKRAATDSHGGRFDFPGGSAEPTDATLLDGVAREVFEETGFRVSHFREVVRMDKWEKMYPVEGLVRSVKFSFVVDVHNAGETGWEDTVELAEAEHSNWMWVTREEIDKSVQLWRDGKEENSPYTFVGVQGETAAEAWKIYSKLAI